MDADQRKHRRWFSRPIIVVPVVAALVILIAFACRRAEITDPLVLEKMTADDLRATEVETLVLAAFQKATKVTIRSEVEDSNGRYRMVVVSDRDELDRLAASIGDRHDDGQPATVYLPHPGIDYVHVSIEGPFRLDFVFSGTSRILVIDKGAIEARPPFGRKIAELLDLQDARQTQR